ncbi:MAG: hypothetical protein JNK04_11865, partial [Myxococcales bacterium]|nr:hypothetical protein [Myxococcales bacterium]
SLFWSVLCVALAAFGFAQTALAAGSVTATPNVLEEVDGQWKLKLKIDYGSMPEQQYIPVLFGFEQVVLYERALTDEGGDKPQLNKKNLVNQPVNNIDQVIGFSDGTGKLFKGTNFTFSIRRDRGFEAGEYMVTIKKSDGGAPIGQKFRITLKGDNPVVDRRAISFVGEKPKEKKDKPKPAATEAAPETEPASADVPAGDTGSTGSGEGPPPVDPKQGGCGCEVPAASNGGPGALAVGLLGAGLVVGRRRQRKRGRPADPLRL